jgi:hypothetical protein
MDRFMWWSGVALWGFLAIAGLLAIGDQIVEWVITSLWSKREFLSFVWAKMKRKSAH